MKNKKLKKVLLIGCGSEIGSMLISMNDSKKDGFIIDTVLTKKIDKKDSLKSIYARMVILNPNLVDKILINQKKDTIKINNKEIKFIWGDIKKIKVGILKKKFDATIVATSKIHISNKNLMKKFLKISNYVLGVAESENIPSLYPNLISTKSKIIEKNPQNVKNVENKIFALGSCQSNGWQAQLKALTEIFKNSELEYFKMLGTEVDIVHPDTPQGRLGTKSIQARDQDARNNLRPSFSQVKISMDKLFPSSNNVHTISLRTLVNPPGFQIVRFYFKHKLKNGKTMSKTDILGRLKEFSKKNPEILRLSDSSLGSRAYESMETSAVTLAEEKYFHYYQNIFSTPNNRSDICQIIMQSYIHNTRGYCRSVLNCLSHIFKKRDKTFYFANKKH